LLAGVPAGGYAVHRPGRQTVTVTGTVPKTVYITKWKTHTETNTVTAPAAAPSIPCQEISGSIEPGVITPGLPGDTACTVTLLSPMGASHLAQIVLTALDGTTSTWNLANPNG
jgi:hypothetical protein